MRVHVEAHFMKFPCSLALGFAIAPPLKLGTIYERISWLCLCVIFIKWLVNALLRDIAAAEQ